MKATSLRDKNVRELQATHPYLVFSGSAEKVYRTIRPVVLILVGFRPAMQLFEGFLRLDPGMIHQD
jgi:hypothetical protein